MRAFMRKQRYLLSIVIIAVFGLGAALVIAPRIIHAAAFTVCSSGCDSTTINGAIALASNGDTISVAAGTYNEQVVINLDNLTLQGAGVGSTTIQNTSTPNTGTGITLSGSRTGVTIKDLTITGFQDGIDMFTGPLTNITLQDIASTSNARHGIWSQAFGVTGLTLLRVNASNNNAGGGASGRGVWIINGDKTNISIQDGTYNNNGLVGIDLSDGTATGVTITGNTVVGNGDSGIAVLGAKGTGANLISGNTVTNNGRYGIEIKNSTGSGAVSGAGSLVVSNNVVTRTVAATDARDYAGIAVIRRSPVVGVNADQPTGAVITGNTVAGFQRKSSGSTGDGFGIVVAGLNNTIQNNFVTSNDIGIQVQGGNVSNTQSTDYFDRDDAANGSATITSNLVRSNTSTGIRAVTLLTNTSPMITAHTNCIVSNVTLGAKNDLAAGGATFDAANNWWGAASGPFNATSNPSGTGNGASDNIGFSPFTTVPAAVCAGPVTTNVVANPNPVTTGNTIALSATTSDSTTGNFAISSAEYNVDGGSYSAMSAQDGSFDQVTEGVKATVAAFTTTGTHTLCVRGTDAAGNIGATSCIRLIVGVPGNGGAAPGVQPGSTPSGQTGGPIASSGNGNSSSSSSTNGGAATTNGASQRGGLPVWLLVAIVALALVGGAGGTLYVWKRRAQSLR